MAAAEQLDSDTGADRDGDGPPRARLGRALRAGLGAAWDRLGLVLALSLTMTGLLFAAVGAATALPRVGLIPPVVFAVVAAVLALSSPAAGAFAVAHRIAEHDEAGYADVWREARRLFGPATRLGLILAAFPLLAVLNAVFYARASGAGGVVAVVFLYAVLFWVMAAVYAFPLLAAQEAGAFDEAGRRAKRGAFAALRRSVFLALGSPFYTLGLVAAMGAVFGVLMAVVVPAVLLGFGALVFLSTWPTRALLVQYGVLPPPPADEAVPDEKFRVVFKDGGTGTERKT